MARWIIRSALRALREQSAMTQGTAARKLDWSLSKVQRIESGDVSVSLTNLLSLLRLYDPVAAVDEDTARALVRTSRRNSGWWSTPEDAPVTGSAELIQFEADATCIRWWHTLWVPELVQTEAYAAAVLACAAPQATGEQHAALLARQQARRDQFLRRATPSRCLILLEESVLRGRVGDPHVQLDQLTDLLHHLRGGAIELAIVPAQAPLASLPALTPFALIVLDLDGLDMAAHGSCRVLFDMNTAGYTFSDTEILTQSHHASWSRSWDAATRAHGAERVLRRHIDTICRQLDAEGHQTQHRATQQHRATVPQQHDKDTRGLTGGKRISKHLAIADHVRDLIRTGQVQPGHPIPTGTQLARDFHASTSTVQAAMLTLKTEGWIFGHQGSGIFATTTIPQHTTTAATQPSTTLTRSHPHLSQNSSHPPRNTHAPQ